MMRTEFHWPRGRRTRPVIDMTLEGEFADPPSPTPGERVFGVAVLVAVVAGALALAALAFYVALLLIPVAFAAGVIAYGAYRWRLWRAQRDSIGGQRDLFRP